MSAPRRTPRLRPGHRLAASVAAAVLLVPTAATAQETAAIWAARCGAVGGGPEPLHLDAARLAELTGALQPRTAPVLRPGARLAGCASRDTAGLQLVLLPLASATRYNSAYPTQALDGLRWAGRGLSTELRGGVAARWGPVSAAFAPVFAYHENAPFPTLPVMRPGSSQFAWPWAPTAIDWPQRFGATSFWSSHPGESFVRADAFSAAIGFSTETIRWGPARRNPLLMSGAAPGFPHVFVGTSSPVDIFLGHLAIEALWGHLDESDHFDGNPTNDTRVLAGLVAAFSPRGLPGLSVGFARSYLRTLPPGGWGLLDYLREPYTGLAENVIDDPAASENQLFSFFGRWVLPESGFEVYGELARDDAWDTWDDLIQEPEHSSAYAVGLQRVVPIGSGPRLLRVAIEAVNLNAPETQRTGRPEVIFYTHSTIGQGYTHRGQLLGAPVGPAGDGQFLEIDVLSRTWMAGVHVRRVRYANDIYWQAFAPRYGYFGHDVELTGGLRGGLLRSELGLEVAGDLSWSGRYNRDFIALTGTGWDTGFEHNLSVQLSASWTPPFGRSDRGGDPPSRPMRP